MRRKLPVLILALIILVQAFVPAIYAASENEAISSNIYLCPFDTTSEGAGKSEKVVPNPFGKSGGPAHQGKIQDIAQEMRSKGYDISFEQYVKTPGGNKSSRYGDILVTNPQTGEQWIVQVGKQTKAGNPVSRELKAIEDLQNAGWRVDYNAYN